MMISFTVLGTAVPQGSMRAFMPKGWKRPIITSDNKKLKPWRQEVGQLAQSVMGDLGLSVITRGRAVRMEARFYFARPKSARKNSQHKCTKPDLDKLARSLGDALTGICFEDDSQITQLWISKFFSHQPRTEVRITELDS